MRTIWICKTMIFAAIFFAVGSLPAAKPAFAASAQVELSSDATEVTVGDEFFVYVTIKSAEQFGDFEASLTYDDDILEYQSGSSPISGGDGFLKMNEQGVAKGVTDRKYTMKFEAAEVGLCKLAFSGSVMVYDYETGTAMSVSSNSLSVNVKAPATASSNARLKSLKVTPGQLTPEFSADILEYGIEVPYDTSQLIIAAIPEDEKATVKIDGNDSLKEGENKISITVLAESGNDIEYSIKANREAASGQASPAPEDIIPPGSFEVVQAGDSNYVVFGGSYKLLEPGSEVDPPEGFTKTMLKISDISITAFSPTDDLGSEFLLLYAENEKGEAGFYRYDRVERTMQRYRSGEGINAPKDTVALQPQGEGEEEYRSNLTKAWVVIALLTALCALLMVLLIRMFMKLRGYKEDDLE